MKDEKVQKQNPLYRRIDNFAARRVATALRGRYATATVAVCEKISPLSLAEELLGGEAEESAKMRLAWEIARAARFC